MQPAGEVAQLGQTVAQLADGLSHSSAHVLGQVALLGQPHLQVDRDRDEALLRAVMEVALDREPGAVGRFEDPCPGRAHLRQLGPDDLLAAQCFLGGLARRDVEDRAVQPPPAVAGIAGLAAVEHPPDVALAVHDPVLDRVRPSRVDPLAHRALNQPAVVGMDDTGEAPHPARDEIRRRVTGDLLDLAAEPLHRPIRVTRTAIDDARNVGHQRAQQHLAGTQPRRPQAAADTRGQHLGLERDPHHVIGAGVQRRTQLGGGLERRGQDDVHGRQPRIAAKRAHQRAAARDIGDHDLRRMTGNRSERLRHVVDGHDRQPGLRQHRPRIRADIADADHHDRRAAARHAVQRPDRAPRDRSAPAPRGRPLDLGPAARHRDDRNRSRPRRATSHGGRPGERPHGRAHRARQFFAAGAAVSASMRTAPNRLFAQLAQAEAHRPP